MMGLAEMLAQVLPDTEFVCPHAPFPFDFAPVGRQWFPLVELTTPQIEAGVRSMTPSLQRFFAAECARLGLPHRAGVLACWQGVRSDPVALVCRAPAALTSMRWMLEAAGIPATGPLGMLRAKGLLAVWVSVFRTWEGDESADLAPTMAALDTALARAESLAATLEPLLGGKRRPEEPASAPSESDEPGPPPGASSEPDTVK